MRPIVKLSQGRIVYSLDDSMAIISVRAWDGVSSAVLGKTVVLRRGGFASMLVVPSMLGFMGSGLGRPFFDRGVRLPALDVWQRRAGRLERLDARVRPYGGGWPVRLMRVRPRRFVSSSLNVARMTAEK